VRTGGEHTVELSGVFQLVREPDHLQPHVERVSRSTRVSVRMSARASREPSSASATPLRAPRRASSQPMMTSQWKLTTTGRRRSFATRSWTPVAVVNVPLAEYRGVCPCVCVSDVCQRPTERHSASDQDAVVDCHRISRSQL